MTKQQKEPASPEKKSKISLKKLSLKRNKPAVPPKKISGSFRLFADSVSLLRQHWKIFGGIILTYFLLTLVLVGGLGGSYDFKELMSLLSEEFGQLNAGVALFSLLIGSAGNATTESGSVYQAIILLVVSLSTIWALRQVLAGNKIQVRDAFYKGMYPFVPFVLVLLFLCMVLMPALLGSYLFSTIFTGSYVNSLLEQSLWTVLIVFLISLSFYLVITFIFAIYIVALPDMRPVPALKAARKLVMYRRWAVTRKLLFLPFSYLIIAALVLLPLLLMAPVLVQWVFVILSMTAVIFAHIYLYSLYKELL